MYARENFLLPKTLLKNEIYIFRLVVPPQKQP